MVVCDPPHPRAASTDSPSPVQPQDSFPLLMATQALIWVSLLPPRDHHGICALVINDQNSPNINLEPPKKFLSAPQLSLSQSVFVSCEPCSDPGGAGLITGTRVFCIKDLVAEVNEKLVDLGPSCSV